MLGKENEKASTFSICLDLKPQYAIVADDVFSSVFNGVDYLYQKLSFYQLISDTTISIQNIKYSLIHRFSGYLHLRKQAQKIKKI